MSLMLYNNTANRHQHILDNGMKVTHSHPFDTCGHGEEPCKCHHHNEKELLFYTLLSDTPEVEFFISSVIAPEHFIEISVSFYRSPLLKTGDCNSLPLLRAPPVINS